MQRTIPALVLLAAAAALAWGLVQRFRALEQAEAAPAAGAPPVPVEVGPVERGAITLRRTFSGTLEAAAEVVVAPKVSGRLAHLAVDLGDEVERGQVVARLDDAEFQQALRQAEAELAVARASHSEAQSHLTIAQRALQRAQALRGEGVTSESDLDNARAGELAARARVEVTAANIARAEAALEASRLRLQDAQISAEWEGGEPRRVVAERYLDEGSTVSAGEPLLRVVEVQPILAVVHVPERDYSRLAPGQHATLTTDSYPSASFAGELTRIAPVFRRSTRQARVELRVANEDQRLKPGMFVRATLELERVEDATVVPFDALIERDARTGLFVLDAAGERVAWLPVEVGVREGARVQVLTAGLAGRVVTLGQELCDDGSRVTLGEAPLPAAE